MTGKGRALTAAEDFDHLSRLIRNLSAGRQRCAEVIKNRFFRGIREKREVPCSKGQTSGEQQGRRRLSPLHETTEY